MTFSAADKTLYPFLAVLEPISDTDYPDATKAAAYAAVGEAVGRAAVSAKGSPKEMLEKSLTGIGINAEVAASVGRRYAAHEASAEQRGR
jgi:hypothetical protein